MTRPHHSFAGFRRYAQMSATQAFLLVEGRHVDSFFYAELCRPVCQSAGISYEIVIGDRIGKSGGKQTLVGFYQYLKSTNSLAHTKAGRASFFLFYLDKDVDDVLRKLITCRYVVYTPFYNAENALYIYADLVRAAAATSSLDSSQFASRLSDADAWRREVAERWKDFVVLCLISVKNGWTTDCNYRRSRSPLNNPPESETDAAALESTRTDLRDRSHLSIPEFDRKFLATRRLVQLIYRQGQHDRVFNGKWYRELAMREIELAADGRQYNRHALANALTAALASTIDFAAEWTEHFRRPLRSLIEATDHSIQPS